MRLLPVTFSAVLALLVAIASPVRAQQAPPVPANGGEPAFLAISGGVFDVNDEWTAGELRAEYRFAEKDKLWLFTPFFGVMTTTDAALYGYAEVGIDIFFGRRWVLTPNFAAGLYHDGNGKDLGHVVEFRSGLELAYRFDDRSRLGIAFHHISNASLDDHNPGTESIVITYSHRFDALF